MNDLETVEGSVCEIIYANYANGYTVCDVECTDKTITATGYMPYVACGDTVRLCGAWVNHPDYGVQFSVKEFEKKLPDTSAAILKYLGSGIIRGIRLATAKKIVDFFGDDTLNVILNYPKKLAQVNGISESRAEEIGKEYAKQQSMQKIMMFLQNYGIGSATAIKVHKHFGTDAVDIIKKNPYILANEISGISFKTADKIALMLGGKTDEPERIKSGILFILSNNAQSMGHTFLPKDELVLKTQRELGVEIAQAEAAVLSLVGENRVYIQNICGYEAVFLESMLFAESLISNKILAMINEEKIMEQKEAEDFIAAWEQSRNLKLDEKQREAVHRAAESGIFVLTGGPGTGKTTVLNAVIDMFEKKKINCALAAPTGRAAKRLSEMTGRSAQTIHRLLEIGYSGDDEIKSFTKDETNPLEQSAFIIDETSMIDVNIGCAFLRAVKLNSRVVFVGDADQLPPVGAGNMLSDMLKSGVIPTVRLTKIFRQAEKSMIVRNAHRVMQGLMPLANEKNADFFFIERNTGEQIAETVCELCKTRIPVAYNQNPMTQIQVLSPMRKTTAGVNNLNICLQRALNPYSKSKNEYKHGSVIYREGDKIMHIKNNYDIEWESVSGAEEGMGVFNGDMGFIEKIDLENRELYAVYDDKRVCYSFDMIDEIEHAYAITVHKSQGSEFDTVIMPVMQMPPMLMRRNLFYTAITRAKKLVILVGRSEAVWQMVSNDYDAKRYTSLESRLKNGDIK